MNSDVRVGKSAGGATHLSAVVFCGECRMWVELGTEDCPHAIEMHKQMTKPNPVALAYQRGFDEAKEMAAQEIESWNKWYDEDLVFLKEVPDSWTGKVMRTMIPRLAAAIRKLEPSTKLEGGV